MKKLSVIIINYGTATMTEKVIRNFIAEEKGLNYEIILIDNKSEEELDESRFADLDLKIIKNQSNTGFAKAVNQGIREAQGEFILLLNSDVFIKNKTVSILIDYLEKNPEAAIIGPRLLFPDGRRQISAGSYPGAKAEFLRLSGLYKYFPHSTLMSKKELADNTTRKVGWVSGGCLLFRASLLEEIGYLDENYFLGGEDIDFCYQAAKFNKQVIYHPTAEALHHHGYSSGGTNTPARIRRDMDGMIYFISKNFSEKTLSRLFIKYMHYLKIAYAKTKERLKAKKYSPRDATIAITHHCNSRCQMCNIWQDKNPAVLPVSAFNNLSPDLRYINLSGGEPFLHPDLIEIVKTVNQNSPKAKIIISTNGLLSNLIVERMAEIKKIDPRVGVRVSIDGLSDTHDKIRGIPGIFRAAMETVAGLKKIGIKNLGISFTIMDNNVAELKDVYDLSQELGVELALAAVQNSDIYFNKKDNRLSYVDKVREGLNYIIAKELKSPNPKHWLRAYYDFGLLHYAEKGERLLKSGAGFNSMFIDASGNIFPSMLITLKIGNLRENHLDEIWNSPVAGKVRAKIINENIQESWIVCTIREEMKRNAPKVLKWIFVNKFKS